MIARGGKPLVKVVPLDTPTGGRIRRIGFMDRQFTVPDDFDSMGSESIEQLFEAAER